MHKAEVSQVSPVLSIALLRPCYECFLICSLEYPMIFLVFQMFYCAFAIKTFCVLMYSSVCIMSGLYRNVSECNVLYVIKLVCL